MTHRTEQRLTLLKCAADENVGWWQRVKDTVSNTAGALRAGQLPLPHVTVGDRFKNRPIMVAKGQPVYIGMAGSDPSAKSDLADSFNLTNLNWQKSGDRGDTQMFRWFDRAEAQRAIARYAKDHPVYAFGESYGGRAIADAVKEQTNDVQGVVMYDPVCQFPFSAPTNTRTKAVNIYPHYRWNDGFDSIIATLGGRHPTLANAETVPYGQNGYATHRGSSTPLGNTIWAKEYARQKELYSAAPRTGVTSSLLFDLTGIDPSVISGLPSDAVETTLSGRYPGRPLPPVSAKGEAL